MRSDYLQLRQLLSKISDKMALRVRKEKESRHKKNVKITELFEESPKVQSVDENEILQCFTPIVGCTRKGEALPKSVIEGGVKMRCTNEKCEYARFLVHSECFMLLENHLIKVISNIGSARGWTDIQRRHNLWEKKGLTLVQKLLRCKCDRGQMVRDTDFYKELKESKTVPTVDAPMGCKQKRKKKKELPRLNFGYNSIVSTPTECLDVYKKKFLELESHLHDEDSSTTNSLCSSNGTPSPNFCDNGNNNNNNNSNNGRNETRRKVLLETSPAVIGSIKNASIARQQHKRSSRKLVKGNDEQGLSVWKAAHSNARQSRRSGRKSTKGIELETPTASSTWKTAPTTVRQSRRNVAKTAKSTDATSAHLLSSSDIPRPSTHRKMEKGSSKRSESSTPEMAWSSLSRQSSAVSTPAQLIPANPTAITVGSWSGAVRSSLTSSIANKKDANNNDIPYTPFADITNTNDFCQNSEMFANNVFYKHDENDLLSNGLRDSLLATPFALASSYFFLFNDLKKSQQELELPVSKQRPLSPLLPIGTTKRDEESEAENCNGLMGCSNTMWSETLKCYTLFGQSTSFSLGERLLAEHYLPSSTL